MVPRLTPTRPPAMLFELWLGAPATVTFAADDESTIELWLVFWPTRPPAMMPLPMPPLTVPLTTWTLETVPAFWPASTPMIWVLPVAVMLAFARLRLRTTPVELMNGNRPIGVPLPARLRLLIV